MVYQFPALTELEFDHACQALKQYSKDQLTGSSWVEVTWSGKELIILEHRDIHTHSPSDADPAESSEDKHIENSDPEAFLRHSGSDSDTIDIRFSIVLSSIYQVPVLWFDVKPSSHPKRPSLDFIYSHIVMRDHQDGLRQLGVLGGISIADHPITDRPAFFIHPCRTQEALNTVIPNKAVTPLEYLMLWFGIIASSVGLSVPSKVAAALAADM